MDQRVAMFLTPPERVAWDVYFSAIVSLRCHPANTEPVDLKWCADLVEQMILVRRERTSCHG